ncbi:MAG: hypothetical protein AAGF31_05665 [Planctomycetota bacterium]
MRKEKVQAALDAFDEEVDIDAFLEKVYLLRKIELGEQDIEAGRVVPHKDAKQRLDRWLA